MKYLFIMGLFSLLFGCQKNYQKHEAHNQAVLQQAMAEGKEIPTIYPFTVKDIDGNDFSFEQLKGKKIMVVNTASKCGFTPQYEQLEDLYEKYKDQNFVIVGFPSNDFMGQEPGSNDEIKQFCQKNYGVTFPMMSKIKVKGKDKAPIYKFLTSKAENGFKDSKVEWNFQKYLIDSDGTLAGVYSPKTLPNDPAIINWIESKN